MDVLETNRLIFRVFAMSDAEFFFKLNINPDGIKYTDGVSSDGVEQTRSFIRGDSGFERLGMGRLLVQVKGTNLKIGCCGLKCNGMEGCVDLGFRFLIAEWNKGSATEARLAYIDLLKKKGIKTMEGRAMKEHKSSIQVHTKLGFIHWKEIENGLEGGMQSTLIL
ncbi:MAG: ribosomal-protein-alanine N-acetyltransferase [Flavobacteriales bacterium]|jgi:ribosomal-protein-alanine N-acetyltransferase